MLLDSKPPPLPITWPLFPQPDDEGQMAFPCLAESIRQNLQVMLSTRPGEQLMRPDYGAGLVDFLGESNTTTTRRRIYDRVVQGIGRWETRIDVNRVEVDAFPGRSGQLRVEVAYRIRRTGELRTLGVNLDLES
jgi:phage baseplate assembly protein W